MAVFEVQVVYDAITDPPPESGTTDKIHTRTALGGFVVVAVDTFDNLIDKAKAAMVKKTVPWAQVESVTFLRRAEL